MFGIFESTEGKAKRLYGEYVAIAGRIEIMNEASQHAALVGLGASLQHMLSAGHGDPLTISGAKAKRLAASLRTASREFANPITQLGMQLLAVVVDAGSCDHPIAHGIRGSAQGLFLDAKTEFFRSKAAA